MSAARRARYGLVSLAVFTVGWLLWTSRGALLPFVVGGIIAFLLAPLVERLARLFPFHRTRHELARTISILIVYVLGFGSLILAGVLLIPALIDEGTQFVDNLPSLVETAQARAQEWSDRYRERVPPAMQERVDAYVQDLGSQIGGIAGAVLSRTFSTAGSVFGLVFGYVVVPFWLFYVLKDRHSLGPAIQRLFPLSIRPDVDACIAIVQRVCGSYIRAQLTLGLFIGVVTTLGLFVLGVNYFVVLGIIAGITELIPVIGPIIGAIPALIVVLATEPEKALLVLIFYVLVQQLENAVLVPRIQGDAVDMHPAVIIILLVVAQQVAGFFGMIVAVPIAAVARDLFRYIHRRLQEHEEAEASKLPSPPTPLPTHREKGA